MSFDFKKSSCGALGTFNIYIVQPGWLTEVGILPRETEIAIEANLDRPGFKFSSKTLGSTWIVSPGKLIIETQDPEFDCGDRMAAVLEKLRHTPVFELANIFRWQGKIADVDPFPALAACGSLGTPPTGYEPHKRTLALSVERDNRKFIVQLTVDQEFVEIAGLASVRPKIRGLTDEAVEVARLFRADRSEIASLVRQMLGVSLNVASSS